MAKQTANNVKLGILLITGIFVLVFSLYMIGQNHSLFGANFELKARFRNINGLVKGNNVRFSGIQAGTVKDISIINDTAIEVTMLIEENIRRHIHKNSVASIGSEGLMGNKIINISPNTAPGAVVEEGDRLLTAREISMDDMLVTLDKTSANAEVISEQLKEAVTRVNNSQAIWDLLSDTGISRDVKISIHNIKRTSEHLHSMSQALNEMIRHSEGDNNVLGLLLKDSAAARKLGETITQINNAANEAGQVMKQLHTLTAETGADLQNGKGMAHAFLKDSAMVYELKKSLDNIERGTAAFNENMEALKHNFLFRKYFKKQERMK